MTIHPVVVSVDQKIRFLQEEFIPFMYKYYAEEQQDKLVYLVWNFIDLLINKENDEQNENIGDWQ